MNEPWQYDETAQVGTDYRDESEVAAYDERMQKLRNTDVEVADIAKALNLSANSTVWEIGTGTGECAITLARKIKHVYATDVSPAMLEYARQKANRCGIANVTFAHGGFLSGFRPDYPVDGIVTQLALHHLPDFWKWKAISIIANSLLPQGRIYFRDVVFPSTTDDYNAFFRVAIEGVRFQAGDDVAEQTVQHIKTEFSTLDWIFEGMIARNGLTIVEKRAEGLLSVYICEK